MKENKETASCDDLRRCWLGHHCRLEVTGGCSGIFLLTDPGDVLSSYAFIYKYMKMEKVKLLSHVLLFVAPWTVAHQAPPSIGFSRHEYWSGLPFLSWEIFLTQGLNLGLLHCRQTFYCLSVRMEKQNKIKLLFGVRSSALIPVLSKKASSGRQADVCWPLLATNPHHNCLLSYSSAGWNRGWQGTIKQSAGVFGRGWDVSTHAAQGPAGHYHLSRLVASFAWGTLNFEGG